MFAGSACSFSFGTGSLPTSQTISEDELSGIQYEIYILAQNSGYTGTYEEWLASIRGEAGLEGRSAELRFDEVSGYIQWRYTDEDETAWRNLIAIEDLIGPAGQDGVTPHIGENGNWWIGETDTCVLAEGTNGLTPFVGENGNWWIGETDTGIQAEATDGKSAYEIY